MVLIADINVAHAVVAAVNGGAQVISISLGGYPAPILEWVITWAVAQNVIVVAAAGNVYPFVVYPAAYPACIGVGASTIDGLVGVSARLVSAGLDRHCGTGRVRLEPELVGQ